MLTAIIVLIIEAIQPWYGRTLSLRDVYTSYLGIITFICLRFARNQPLNTKISIVSYVLILICVVSYPTISAWHGVLWRYQQAPNLANFEKQSEMHVWRSNETGHNASHIERSNDVAYEGEYSLKFEAGTTQWSGVVYNIEHQDWQPYENLIFHVYNPSETFKLLFRIDDDGNSTIFNNRYNNNFTIPPGWKKITIPLHEVANGPTQRTMNMDAIQRMQFFITRKTQTRVFYLDKIYLE